MTQRIYRAKVYSRNRRTGEYLDCGWVYGDYYRYYNGSLHFNIVTIDDVNVCSHEYSVDPCSVSQSIGKSDVDNKEIFEGDIVRHRGRYFQSIREYVSVVVWNQDECCYELVSKGVARSFAETQRYKVIGNIVDNKELKLLWDKNHVDGGRVININPIEEQDVSF